MNLSALSVEHRRYLKSEVAINSIINAIISALFAWLFFRGVDVIPLWGAMGMAVDLIPTVFMITLATSLIATGMTRKKVRGGAILALPGSRSNYPFIRSWPSNIVLRSLMLAFMAAVIMVPPSIGAMMALSVTEMAFPPFVIFKVVYGAIVTTLVAPGILMAALTDEVQDYRYTA